MLEEYKEWDVADFLFMSLPADPSVFCYIDDQSQLYGANLNLVRDKDLAKPPCFRERTVDILPFLMIGEVKWLKN